MKSGMPEASKGAQANFQQRGHLCPNPKRGWFQSSPVVMLVMVNPLVLPASRFLPCLAGWNHSPPCDARRPHVMFKGAASEIDGYFDSPVIYMYRSHSQRRRVHQWGKGIHALKRRAGGGAHRHRAGHRDIQTLTSSPVFTFHSVVRLLPQIATHRSPVHRCMLYGLCAVGVVWLCGVRGSG